MKLTKEIIRINKENRNYSFFKEIFNSDNKTEIIFVLENIGKIPNEFPYSLFLNLLENIDEDIRYNAVKCLGRIKNPEITMILKKMYHNEKATKVRREIVSSLGRQRDNNAFDIFFYALNEKDPKIVLQAIRALTYFKNDPYVITKMKEIKNNVDDIVVDYIEAEFFETTNNKLAKKDKERLRLGDTRLRNVLVLGDVRKILECVPDNSIHLTFTSPPYFNARDYSIYRTYEEYLNFLEDVIREIHRITIEGRFFVLNTSPVIIPRVSRKYSSKRYLIPFDIHPRIIDIGFEFIEDIIWVKPEPSVINRNGGFFQHRKPLAYKANSVTEYVIVYRKKTRRLIDWNISLYDNETINQSKVIGNYETSNLWKIGPTSNKIHPAVFPEELVKNIVQFYSMKGDIIFDPFGGVGTVGVVSKEMGRYYFLTEINRKYTDEAVKQLSDLVVPCKYMNSEIFYKYMKKECDI